ncbi:MAG: DNA-directed DNA polymerase [Candidatus Bilamarchaeaceae archaeon]
MKIRKAFLLSLGYVIKGSRTYVSLLLKGKKTVKRYYQCDPYFLVDAPAAVKDDIKKISVEQKGKMITPLAVEETERLVKLKKKKFLKVLCREPSHVPLLKRAIPYPCYEFEIPFVRRFLFDMQLTPNWLIRYEREGKIIRKILSCEPVTPSLKTLAFDIETYNPLGTPRPKKDPVLIISYTDSKSGALTYKPCSRAGVEIVKDEKELLERFSRLVAHSDPDVLVGYNSGNFDLPYLYERARLLKSAFNLGRWKGKLRSVKRGMIGGASISDRLHLDLYPIIRLFGFIGVLKTSEFTLNAVANEVLGKKKISVKRADIWRLWDENRMDELIEYAVRDAELTKALCEVYLPLELELSSITKLPLFDVSLATSGQLVENLLMYNAAKRGELIQLRPVGEAIEERLANPIKGAFVKLPEPGIYEQIAVLDFRGLYPSIIVSYNIDPATLTESHEDETFVSPTGAQFKKSPKGLIPSVLEELIDLRSALKKRLKTLDPTSREYKILSARSQAIKILSNSFYGYLGYARSRWYSRKCAESVTAWGRKHIHDTIEAAEKSGFKVLYADTDSVFLVYKSKEEVLNFVDKINKSLPEKMELEIEGFYPRGVFVSKKAEEKGAKKKYALLSEDGRIKIRGFELVRRDWSQIAKETQYHVLEAILREGSREKAVAVVREAIERLKSGAVDISELAIVTQLNKDPRAGYEVISPELAAAKKLIAEGVPVEKGSIISYVITKKGSSISEKAMPTDSAEDYDIDYYINNQILPAVMKILRELGYDEYRVKVGGRQRLLNSFFE